MLGSGGDLLRQLAGHLCLDSFRAGVSQLIELFSQRYHEYLPQQSENI